MNYRFFRQFIVIFAIFPAFLFFPQIAAAQIYRPETETLSPPGFTNHSGGQTADGHTGNEDERRCGFFLSPLLGFLYGHGEEILYKYPESDQYVSQLLWDMKPLVYSGIAFETGTRDPFQNSGFTAALSIKFGLPLKTGVMEDRDWMDSRYDYLTHYSIHDAYSQNAVLADISAGYSWVLPNSMSIGVYGEFSFMNLSWSAEDGYVQYANVDGSGNYDSWTSDIEKKYIRSIGIRYIQTMLVLSPGVSLGWKMNRLWSFDCNFGYSPLVYIRARDDHLIGSGAKTFGDSLWMGHYIKGGAGLRYSPLSSIDFSLSLSYRRITGPRGDSYYRRIGYDISDIVVQNVYDGGAGHSAFDVTFAVRIIMPEWIPVRAE